MLGNVTFALSAGDVDARLVRTYSWPAIFNASTPVDSGDAVVAHAATNAAKQTTPVDTAPPIDTVSRILRHLVLWSIESLHKSKSGSTLVWRGKTS
jgi:hypothetical protein